MDTLGAITRGDYEEIPFTATDAAGAPLNLTGKTIRFTARRDYSAATAIISKSSAVAGEIEVTNAAAGEGKVVLTGEEEGVLAMRQDKRLVCDIEVTDGQGRPATTRFWLSVEMDVST